MNSNYSWVIYKYNQSEEYIDAKKETHANWMRYVNCARNNEEQNLVAFQYQGRILYRCCQNIKPGQELLVWSEEEHAKDFDSMFDCLIKK
ncbi:histone-lysine N-methyltransferase PRDM7-like [Neoarius graeffei]|uniref:histone-lysine N-methyltransferase PRDM7-like n=1 Tax=Neoarius graeffei TaxID=443677 RepID=UPI00298C67F3|nr:histone-lysine N-methyltransferase PRDM7-like [Neoarius graeffei]